MLKSSLKMVGIAALVAAPVLAQQTMDHSKMQGMDNSKMQGMDHSKMQGMDHSKMMQNTAANPYAQSEMKMHDAMMKAVGADASETWVRKMLEHHRGGVEMSKIAMAQAKDKEVRDQAQKTITEQTRTLLSSKAG